MAYLHLRVSSTWTHALINNQLIIQPVHSSAHRLSLSPAHTPLRGVIGALGVCELSRSQGPIVSPPVPCVPCDSPFIPARLSSQNLPPPIHPTIQMGPGCFRVTSTTAILFSPSGDTKLSACSDNSFSHCHRPAGRFSARNLIDHVIVRTHSFAASSTPPSCISYQSCWKGLYILTCSL